MLQDVCRVLAPAALAQRRVIAPKLLDLVDEPPDLGCHLRVPSRIQQRHVHRSQLGQRVELEVCATDTIRALILFIVVHHVLMLRQVVADFVHLPQVAQTPAKQHDREED